MRPALCRIESLLLLIAAPCLLRTADLLSRRPAQGRSLNGAGAPLRTEEFVAAVVRRLVAPPEGSSSPDADSGMLLSDSSSDQQGITPKVPQRANPPPASCRSAQAEEAKHLASGLLGLAPVPLDPPHNLREEGATPQPAAQSGRGGQSDAGAKDTGFAEMQLRAQAAATGLAARMTLWHLRRVRCAGFATLDRHMIQL